MWFARPPSLSLYEPGRYGSHIDGSEGLGHGIEPLQGLAAHFALIYHPNDVLVIPTLGVTFGGAVGGWGTSTRYDGLTFSPDGLSFFATIDVIGIGVQAKLGSVTLSATTRAGIDVFAVGGRLSDPQIAEDATGKAYAIALRGDLRACVRAAHDGSSRVCLFGGPNFVEGSHLMNGGYAGIGATF